MLLLYWTKYLNVPILLQSSQLDIFISWKLQDTNQALIVRQIQTHKPTYKFSPHSTCLNGNAPRDMFGHVLAILRFDYLLDCIRIGHARRPTDYKCSLCRQCSMHCAIHTNLSENKASCIEMFTCIYLTDTVCIQLNFLHTLTSGYSQAPFPRDRHKHLKAHWRSFLVQWM